VSGNTLQQVETSKHLRTVFTSDGSRNTNIDTQIGKANANLREMCCSVVTKREISNTAKFSDLKSVFVPMLTCGHESWVANEKILSKKQTAEMGYLRRVLDVTLRDEKHRSEIRKARDVKSLIRKREKPAMLVRPCVQNVPGKNGEISPSVYSLHTRESGPEVVQGPAGLTMLRPVAQLYGQVRTDWNQCFVIDCSLSHPAWHKPFTCSHSVLRNT